MCFALFHHFWQIASQSDPHHPPHPSLIYLLILLPVSPSFLPSPAHPSRQRLILCFFNAFLLTFAYFSKQNATAPPDLVLIKHQKRRAKVPTETVGSVRQMICMQRVTLSPSVYMSQLSVFLCASCSFEVFFFFFSHCQWSVSRTESK